MINKIKLKYINNHIKLSIGQIFQLKGKIVSLKKKQVMYLKYKDTDKLRK